MKDFDKKLKQQLESRRIVPSDSSWEKLSHSLDIENGKPQKSYRWLGIAVIFLGGILIGALVFNHGKTLPNKEHRIAVELPKDSIGKEQINSSKKHVAPTSKNSLSPETNIVSVEEKEEKIPKKPAKNLGIVKVIKSEGMEENKKNTAVAMTNGSVLIGEQTNNNFEESLKKPITTEVTDVEIEKLLREAERKIEHRNFSQATQKEVSSQALLNNIEKELKQSDRNRFFMTVKDKLIQLASANRVFN